MHKLSLSKQLIDQITSKILEEIKQEDKRIDIGRGRDE